MGLGVARARPVECPVGFQRLGAAGAVGDEMGEAVGQAEMQDIIQPSGFEENLMVIPSGPVPPNPAELIMLPRMDELMEYLKANFDYILIDTAPIGLVTDALLLNRFSSTTLYVIRQGYTFKQH